MKLKNDFRFEINSNLTLLELVYDGYPVSFVIAMEA